MNSPKRKPMKSHGEQGLKRGLLILNSTKLIVGQSILFDQMENLL